MSNNLWGEDIVIDSTNSPKIASNGELLLTSDVDTPLQDIKLRLFTPLGSLFYDKNFGSLIHEFIFDDNTD